LYTNQYLYYRTSTVQTTTVPNKIIPIINKNPDILVNWTAKGMVTPAKSQGSYITLSNSLIRNLYFICIGWCGSCWAFAATGRLFTLLINLQILIIVSPNFLIS
jgi:hypothetical protein